MRKLSHIYRLRLSDFELEILKTCKENKIKPADFIREAIKQKAEKDFDMKIIVPF
jgi:hypothetical protein